MKKKGYALVTVLILTAILLMVGTTVLLEATTAIKVNKTYENNVDNVNLSLESGIECVYSVLQNFCSQDKYNGETGDITNELALTPIQINNKTVQLKVTADNSYFYIESSIGAKSMKAKVNKLPTSTTVTKVINTGSVTLSQPVALMIPNALAIKRLTSSNGDENPTPIYSIGVNNPYHFYQILSYGDSSKICDITKDRWENTIQPTVNSSYVNGPSMNIGFINNTQNPYSYSPVQAVGMVQIPSYTFTSNKNTGAFKLKNEGNSSIMITYSTSNGYELVNDTTNNMKYYYIDGDLTINENLNNLGNSPIDQDLNGITIVASGNVNITASNTVKLLNANIIARNITFNGWNNVNINNATLHANNIYFSGSNGRYIQNSNITAQNIYDNDSGDRDFSGTTVSCNAFTLTSAGSKNFTGTMISTQSLNFQNDSGDKIFNGANIKADLFNTNDSNNQYYKNNTVFNCGKITFNSTNLISVNNCTINSESISMNGSCDRTFNNSQILCNNFNITVTNGTNFGNTSVTVGIFNISGSCDKTFDNSFIKANTFNINNSSNNVNFNNAKIVSDNLNIVGGSCDRNFNNSIIVVQNEHIEAPSNSINFTNCLNITNKLDYFSNNDIKFDSRSINMNTLNSYLTEASKYVSGLGTTVVTEEVITYKSGNVEYVN